MQSTDHLCCQRGSPSSSYAVFVAWTLSLYSYWVLMHSYFLYHTSYTMLHLKKKTSGLHPQLMAQQITIPVSPEMRQGQCNFSAWNFWLAQAGLTCKDSLVLHIHTCYRPGLGMGLKQLAGSIDILEIGSIIGRESYWL